MYAEYYKAVKLVKQWRETAETWQKLANHATALAEEATADLKKANATIRILRQKRDDLHKMLEEANLEIAELKRDLEEGWQ